MNPAHRTRFLTPGDKLGRYELIRQIAVGGMAEIYLARTVGIEGFEKLIVIKRILPQHASNASLVVMFMNEARLAAALHHPNIAQVHDIGLDNDDYFFAMEYVHGEDLDRIAIASEEQGIPVSLDAALTLVAGLCAGLHYAHEKLGPDGNPLGIVHRDVSPSNVLVSYEGAVKLVDFGIARAASRAMTTQGGIKGKIAYMSPEQGQAVAALDRRSDIYSVGTILYELTTGQLPFSGPSEYALLNQIVNNDVPPPTTIVPGYPPALERIVMRALARDREQRFDTALELQQAVEDFAHESRLRISPLVLGRLMSNLFPARLEEWSQAKTQGAFFVEQHVVRTLIESGKTSDSAPRYEPPVSADTDPVVGNESTQMEPEAETTLAMPPSQAVQQLAAADRGSSPVVQRRSSPALERGSSPVVSRVTPTRKGAVPAPQPGDGAPRRRPEPQAADPRVTPTRPGAVPAPVQVRRSVVSPAQVAPAVEPPQVAAPRSARMQTVDAPTELDASPLGALEEVSSLRSPVSSRSSSRQIAAAPSASTSARLPAQVGAVPPLVAAPGTRVSGGVPDPIAKPRDARAADPTERVRLPQDTAYVRIARGPVPVIPLAIVSAFAIAIAIFIALRDGKSSTSSTPPAAPPPAADPVAAPPLQPAPVAEPAPPAPLAEPPAPAAAPDAAIVEAVAPPDAAPITPPDPPTPPAPQPEPSSLDAAPTTRDARPSSHPAPPVKRVVKPKPKPRPVQKSRPAKETPWNADSPFMPVRH